MLKAENPSFLDSSRSSVWLHRFVQKRFEPTELLVVEGGYAAYCLNARLQKLGTCFLVQAGHPGNAHSVIFKIWGEWDDVLSENRRPLAFSELFSHRQVCWHQKRLGWHVGKIWCDLQPPEAGRYLNGIIKLICDKDPRSLDYGWGQSPLTGLAAQPWQNRTREVGLWITSPHGHGDRLSFFFQEPATVILRVEGAYYEDLDVTPSSVHILTVAPEEFECVRSTIHDLAYVCSMNLDHSQFDFQRQATMYEIMETPAWEIQADEAEDSVKPANVFSFFLHPIALPRTIGAKNLVEWALWVSERMLLWNPLHWIQFRGSQEAQKFWNMLGPLINLQPWKDSARFAKVEDSAKALEIDQSLIAVLVELLEEIDNMQNVHLSQRINKLPVGGMWYVEISSTEQYFEETLFELSSWSSKERKIFGYLSRAEVYGDREKLDQPETLRIELTIDQRCDPFLYHFRWKLLTGNLQSKIIKVPVAVHGNISLGYPLERVAGGFQWDSKDPDLCITIWHLNGFVYLAPEGWQPLLPDIKSSVARLQEIHTRGRTLFEKLFETKTKDAGVNETIIHAQASAHESSAVQTLLHCPPLAAEEGLFSALFLEHCYHDLFRKDFADTGAAFVMIRHPDITGSSTIDVGGIKTSQQVLMFCSESKSAFPLVSHWYLDRGASEAEYIKVTSNVKSPHSSCLFRLERHVKMASECQQLYHEYFLPQSAMKPKPDVTLPASHCLSEFLLCEDHRSIYVRDPDFLSGETKLDKASRLYLAEIASLRLQLEIARPSEQIVSAPQVRAFSVAETLKVFQNAKDKGIKIPDRIRLARNRLAHGKLEGDALTVPVEVDMAVVNMFLGSVEGKRPAGAATERSRWRFENDYVSGEE